MLLEGSCCCGAVTFSLTAPSPVPYMRCYCSICRKSAGGGGYAINLDGLADTLVVRGEDNISVWHATKDGEQSPMERRFCSKCGTALWGWDPRWPDLVHPFASAIDMPLPAAPSHTHIMIGSKLDWVPVDADPNDDRFDEYPDKSLEDWHRAHGCLSGACLAIDDASNLEATEE